MQLVRLTAVALVMASLSGQALALTVDDTTTSGRNGASLAGDPDDKIPYPHVADDGASPPTNFQGQPVGNSGVSFNLAPAATTQDNAFQRAQDRMQQ